MQNLRSLSNFSSSSFIPGNDTGFMLYLRVHSGEKLTLATTSDSFCEVNVTEGDQLPRFYQTKIYKSRSMTIAVWNEKLAIPVGDPSQVTVSIRVKNKNPLTAISIGACTIGLKHLQVGRTIDQSFTLYQGSKDVGRVRLQMMLRDTSTDTTPIPKPQLVESRHATKSSNQVDTSDDSDSSGSSDDSEDVDEEELLHKLAKLKLKLKEKKEKAKKSKKNKRSSTKSESDDDDDDQLENVADSLVKVVENNDLEEISKGVEAATMLGELISGNNKDEIDEDDAKGLLEILF